MANSNEENDESHQIWETHDSEGIPLFLGDTNNETTVSREEHDSILQSRCGSFYGMDSMQVPGVPTNSQVRRDGRKSGWF